MALVPRRSLFGLGTPHLGRSFYSSNCSNSSSASGKLRLRDELACCCCSYHHFPRPGLQPSLPSERSGCSEKVTALQSNESKFNSQGIPTAILTAHGRKIWPSEDSQGLPRFLCRASSDVQHAANPIDSSSNSIRSSSTKQIQLPDIETLQSVVPTEKGRMQPRPEAYLMLFGVAMLWGSYPPAIRYIFLSDEPPGALVMNALQSLLTAGFLAGSCITAAAVTSPKAVVPIVGPEMLNPLAAEAAAAAALAAKQASTVAVPAALEGSGRRVPSSPLEHLVAHALNWTSDSILVVGCELGLWMCLAFGLEVLAVQNISATKTAFLDQATVLMTPLLVHLSMERVQRHEWSACGLGLAGALLVAAEGLMSGAAGAGSAVAHENPIGYVYILVSTVFFAMSTVRLSCYGNRFPSLALAASSTFGLTFFSLLWVAADWQCTPSGYMDAVLALQHLMRDPVSLAVMLWVGLGPGALAAYLQALGQQTVPPAQAQVIYATSPIFSTAIAWMALDSPDEAMGPIAWTGATIMMGASLLASTGEGGGAEGGGEVAEAAGGERRD